MDFWKKPKNAEEAREAAKLANKRARTGKGSSAHYGVCQRRGCDYGKPDEWGWKTCSQCGGKTKA